jgi:hypothetical protein
VVVADGVEAEVAGGAVAAHPARPIIATVRTVAVIHPRLLASGERRPFERVGSFGSIFMISLLTVRKSLSRLRAEPMSEL